MFLSTAFVLCAHVALAMSSSSLAEHGGHHKSLLSRRKMNTVYARTTDPLTMVSGWSYVSCKAEPKTGRMLSVLAANWAGMTSNTCVALCDAGGYTYAGTEFGTQCWCGNSLNGPQAVSESKCTIPCSGDSSETCGASYVLSTYSTSTASTNTNYALQGCFTDSHTRLFSGATVQASAAMTVSICANFCNTAGFTYAGLEAGNECFCGSDISSFPLPSPPASCMTPCTGNSGVDCGGSWQLAVYMVGSSPTTPPAITWSYTGCYVDYWIRVLGGPSKGDATAMTNTECQNWCSSQGYTMAGTEYGLECYCADSLVDSYALSASACNMACPGDGASTCGGIYALSVYTASGPPI